MRVKKIKDLFTGGIESLSELATEFSGHSETTFGSINFEVVEHSSAVTEVSKYFNRFCFYKNNGFN